MVTQRRAEGYESREISDCACGSTACQSRAPQAGEVLIRVDGRRIAGPTCTTRMDASHTVVRDPQCWARVRRTVVAVGPDGSMGRRAAGGWAGGGLNQGCRAITAIAEHGHEPLPPPGSRGCGAGRALQERMIVPAQLLAGLAVDGRARCWSRSAWRCAVNLAKQRGGAIAVLLRADQADDRGWRSWRAQDDRGGPVRRLDAARVGRGWGST